MHRTTLALLYGGMLLLVPGFAACSRSDQQTADVSTSNRASSASPGAPQVSGQTSPDVVRASAAAVSIRAGSSVEAAVELAITNGYHINANPATYPYLIPTKLDIAPEPGIKAGAPVYPTPLTKKFSFDEKPLAVYEGVARIKLPLDVEQSTAKGARTLRAHIRVQPCNDQACFPPRTIEAVIPLTID